MSYPPPPPADEPTPEDNRPGSPADGQPTNPYPSYPPPPPAGNYPNYGQPPAGNFPLPGQPGGLPKSNQKALWSMILGILGFICCGFFASIPAVILGYQARKEVRASGGLQTGEGQAKAGIILGWIGIALTILLIVAVVVIGVAGGFDSSSIDDSYYRDY